MRLLRRHPILLVGLGVAALASASVVAGPSGVLPGASAVGPTLPAKSATKTTTASTAKATKTTSKSSTKTTSKSSSSSSSKADFTVSASPSKRTVGLGDSSTTQVNLKTTGGFSGVVNITSSGTPKGVKLSFPPRIRQFAPVAVSVGDTAKKGTYKITFTGKSAGKTHTTVFTLVIADAGALDEGLLDTLPPVGGGGALEGLPTTVAGATAVSTGPTTTGLVRSLVSTTLAPAATPTTLVGAVPPSTVAGTPSEFSVAVSPARVALAVGGTTNLAITPSFGTTAPANVTYLIAGLPVGVNSSFSPNPSSGPVTLTLSSPTGLSASTSNVVITAQTGSFIRQAQFELILVTDVAVTLSPNTVAATVGGTGLATVLVTPALGFSANMALSVTGLPTGITPAFSTASLASGVSTLSFAVASTVTAGNYNFTVSAVGGGVTRTTTGILSVAGTAGTTATTTTAVPAITTPGSTTGELSISTNPGSRSVSPGGSTVFALTLTGTTTAGATISVSGLPAYTSVSVTPNPSTGNSTLTLSTATNTPTGTYTLTVTATVGATQRATTLLFTVG